VAQRQPATSALDALFWRDEILQVLFWMRGEGLGDTPTASQLAAFLRIRAAERSEHLAQMQTY
jgi:hypothetical protein